MAEYSALKSDFMERTSKAYGRFQRENIPFSALRLGIKAGAHVRSTDMEKIIGRYLRQTDEILGKDEDSYSILMQGTSFDSAIAASKRLATGLMDLKKSRGEALDDQWNASFEIIGCRQGAQGLCRTYLELNDAHDPMVERKSVPREVQSYAEHAKAIRNYAGKPKKLVNVMI